MPFHIKEKSVIASIASWKMGAAQVAIVIGNTIHLHNTTRSEFLASKRWLHHEMEHIRQYQKHGFISFIILYLIESAKRGYYNNKYEVAARAAEIENVLEDTL